MQSEVGEGNDFADKGETVGVGARGRESEEDVARGDIGRGEDLCSFNHTHSKTGKIIVVPVVHARHFCRLTADQCASSLETSLGNTGDHIRGHRHVELGTRIIVEEVERLGTLNDEVVDAHRNEVDTDGAVFPMVKSDTELGSNTVSPRNEDRVLVAGFGKVERTAEPANVRVGTRSSSGLDDGLDSLDEIVTGIDGNAGSGVSEALGLGGGFGGESTVSNVSTEGLALEGDLRDARVGEVDGGAEGRGRSADGEDTAAVGDRDVVGALSTGVEDLNTCFFTLLVDARMR